MAVSDSYCEIGCGTFYGCMSTQMNSKAEELSLFPSGKWKGVKSETLRWNFFSCQHKQTEHSQKRVHMFKPAMKRAGSGITMEVWAGCRRGGGLKFPLSSQNDKNESRWPSPPSNFKCDSLKVESAHTSKSEVGLMVGYLWVLWYSGIWILSSSLLLLWCLNLALVFTPSLYAPKKHSIITVYAKSVQ